MEFDPVIYVADAGSVSKGNFHWVCSRAMKNAFSSPSELASSIAEALKEGQSVALGYESPLFIPCEKDAQKLGKARNGECNRFTGNRPFNAGAGASILATGIQSLAWVLRRIKGEAPMASATTNWADFQKGNAKLLVWEAFVSGSEKAYSAEHADDARLAIKAFKDRRGTSGPATRIACEDTFSLVGAAILFSRLSDDMGLLKNPCIVLRPVFSDAESERRIAQYPKRQTAKQLINKRVREQNSAESRKKGRGR